MESGVGACFACRASTAVSSVFSAPARRATISSCMSKRSASGLSNRSGPKMIARLGVDQLHIDAHAVPAALNAALEDIADVQLAADLLEIDGLGERRVAPNHERASNA
jgi:hypothetical protein